MFRRKNKSVAGLIAMVMAIVMIVTGCGSSASTLNTEKKSSNINSGTNSTTKVVTTEESKKLVVYAAMNEDDIIQIQKQFKVDTGIEIEYIRLSGAGEASTRIQAEKSSPKADIFVGGSTEFYEPLAKEGLFEQYVSPNSKDIESQFNDPNGFWQGWYMGVLAIVYNTERFEAELASKGVAAPQTWDDLLNPAYKDLYVTSNPATAGAGYIFSATQLFRLGEDKGWEYLTSLNDNVHHYTAAASDVINLVATGEFVAGMAWAHDIVKTAKQGYPINVVVPENTAFEIGGSAVIKGGPNTENAKKFIDWILTQPIGEMNTAISNRYSVRTDVAPPEGMIKVDEVKLVEYDRPKAAEMKEKVVQKITDMIGQ